MKNIFALSVVIIMCATSFGQNSRSDAHYNGNSTCDFHCQLYAVANRFQTMFAAQYAHSAAFILFKVDSAGNVADIHYYEGTPKYISDYIMNALFTTNGKWTPAMIDGHPVTSKPFLLPIVFDFDKGGKDPAPSKATYDNATTLGNIMWMTRFQRDTSFTQQLTPRPAEPPMDCILLSPLHLISTDPIH